MIPVGLRLSRCFASVLVFVLLSSSAFAQRGQSPEDIALARKKFTSPLKEVKITRRVSYLIINKELAENYLSKDLLGDDLAMTQNDWLPLCYMCIEDFNKLIDANAKITAAEAHNAVLEAQRYKGLFLKKINEYQTWLDVSRKRTIEDDELDPIGNETPEKKKRIFEDRAMLKGILNADSVVHILTSVSREELYKKYRTRFVKYDDEKKKDYAEMDGVPITFKYDRYLNNCVEVSFKLSGNRNSTFLYSLMSKTCPFKYVSRSKSHTMKLTQYGSQWVDGEVTIYQYKDFVCKAFDNGNTIEYTFYKKVVIKKKTF